MKRLNEYNLKLGWKYNINYISSDPERSFYFKNRKFLGIVKEGEEMELELAQELTYGSTKVTAKAMQKPRKNDLYIFSDDELSSPTAIFPNNEKSYLEIERTVLPPLYSDTMELGVTGNLAELKLLKLYAEMHGWKFRDNGINRETEDLDRLYRLFFDINYFAEKGPRMEFYFTGAFYQPRELMILSESKDQIYELIKDKAPNKLE